MKDLYGIEVVELDKLAVERYKASGSDADLLAFYSKHWDVLVRYIDALKSEAEAEAVNRW